MDYKVQSNSDLDTIELAQNIESERFDKMVICLYGDLGSGKTLFTKAFAKSMGIMDNITSPTFNIIKEYTGENNSNLYHMDVYRLNEVKEDLGIEEYFKKKGVTIIEWADQIEDILPKKRLDIFFKIIDEDKRIIKLVPHGEEYEELINRVL